MHFHNREKVIEIERTEITSVNPGKENIIYLYPSEIKGNASRPINCNDISIRDEIIEFFHKDIIRYMYRVYTNVFSLLFF